MTQAHGRQACRNKPHNSSCVKVFGYPSSLQRHQRTHSEDKHHEYKHYWKVFRECGYVQIHGRTHSGKKLYRWKQSLIFFYSLSSTQRHGETHRGMEHYVSKQWRKTCCVLSSCRRYQNCTVHRKTTYVYNWGKASVLSSTMREPAIKTKPSVIPASFLDRTEITSLCVQVIWRGFCFFQSILVYRGTQTEVKVCDLYLSDMQRPTAASDSPEILKQPTLQRRLTYMSDVWKSLVHSVLFINMKQLTLGSKPKCRK